MFDFFEDLYDEFMDWLDDTYEGESFEDIAEEHGWDD